MIGNVLCNIKFARTRTGERAIMPGMLAKTLQDMFVLNLPVLEKILRPILVYFALVVLLENFRQSGNWHS